MTDFVGSKIALINGDEVLVTQRDDKQGLSFPGMWEFPGGAREGSETPLECAIREVHEELGIELNPNSVSWEKVYPSVQDPNKRAYFFVANITQEEISRIVFGDEGQGWKMLKFNEVLTEPNFIEQFKGRLKDYLQSIK